MSNIDDSKVELNAADVYSSGYQAGLYTGFAMAVLFFLILSLVLSAWVNDVNADEIIIHPHNRVVNRTDQGVCWWACAEMIGKQYDIAPLQTIVKQVETTGIGFKAGATPEAINHWIKTLQLKPRTALEGSRDVDFLQTTLKSGLPVIVSLRDGQEAHAVLLTAIGTEKVDWKDGNGKLWHDFIVTYLDPNAPEHYLNTTWDWFYWHWTGRAYAFDPGEQPLQPRRHLLAQQQSTLRHPLGNALNVKVLPPTYVHQLPPVYPHELPFRTNNAVNYGPYKPPPSNQDIKDGVARPSDTLDYSVFPLKH